MFTAPIYYGTNTPVIFTFEGVDYARPPGAARDLTQVKFEDPNGGGFLDPVSTNNATGEVGYLITVDGGEFYDVDASKFHWPAGYSYTSATSSCSPCPPNPGSSSVHTITDADWLRISGFHNQVALSISGPKTVLALRGEDGPTVTLTANTSLASSTARNDSAGRPGLNFIGTQGHSLTPAAPNGIFSPHDAAMTTIRRLCEFYRAFNRAGNCTSVIILA